MLSPDVCRLTGATYRQLDHWARNGYVQPDHATTRAGIPVAVKGDPAAPGSGNLRRWSAHEVRQVRLMVRLTNAGLTPAAAARVVCGERDIGVGITLLIDREPER